MANETQEQINNRLTQGVAANSASIAVLAEGASTRYKGVKATVADLPASGNHAGDMWYVTANHRGYFWDGTQWNDGSEITKGVSPSVTITEKAYGHDVTITDADHPQGQTFEVRNGEVVNMDDAPTAESVRAAKSGGIHSAIAAARTAAEATAAADATSKANAAKAEATAACVKLTDDQTVAGTKTFSNSPVVPTEEVSESNKLKTVNVEMMMNYFSENGIDGEFIKIMSSDDLSELDMNETVNSTHSTSGLLAICCPNANKFNCNMGSSSVISIGRCSPSDIRESRFYLEAEGTIYGKEGDYSIIVCSGIKNAEFPNATNIDSIGFYDSTSWITPSTFETVIIPRLTTFRAKGSKSIFGTATKHIDIRSKTKSQLADLFGYKSEGNLFCNATTNCIARCSDGYMKYNGSAWVDYTPAE